jgi:hypothetical protein
LFNYADDDDGGDVCGLDGGCDGHAGEWPWHPPWVKNKRPQMPATPALKAFSYFR